MKTYVITLSQKFPATHSKAGQATFFKDKFHAAITHNDEYWNKIHTIRANYPLWRQRMDEILRGEACLSVRQWSDKPYSSKQIEIACLTADDGIDVEELRFEPDDFGCEWAVHNRADDWCRPIPSKKLAMNDGLSLEDWYEWFNMPQYDKSKPFAIIHFTNFRYFD